MSRAKSKAAYAVVQGDCLKLLPESPAAVADLICADPPYGIDWPGYDVYQDNLSADEYLAWSRRWIREVHRILKLNGTFWLASGDEFVSELDVIAKESGFNPRSKVVWYFSFGVDCKQNFARSHIFWLYYTKHRTKFTFNADAVLVPSARQLKYNDRRANPHGKVPENVWVLHPDELGKCFQSDHDTWAASRICGSFREREHRGTYKQQKTCPQMPLAVMTRIVASTSNPGDLVVDPFGGTFSTGEAAVQLGRRFWGCDISADYVKRGRVRLQRAMKGE